METTVAILCYGLFGQDYHRTDKEMAGLKQYFRHCANYIYDLHKQDRLSGIVLCGGVTNPDYHPGVSEAATSANYLKILLEVRDMDVKRINILLERWSFNTAQNIVFTGLLMNGILPPHAQVEWDKSLNHTALESERDNWLELSHNVTFICDKCRYPKVYLITQMANSLLHNQLAVRVKAFPGEDIHPKSTLGKQLGATIHYMVNPNKFQKDLKFKQPRQ